MGTHDERSAQYAELIERQALIQRQRAAGFPIEEPEQDEKDRLTRISELADLLNAVRPEDDRVYDPAPDVEAWIVKHPLLLTAQVLTHIIEERQYRDSGVAIQIGGSRAPDWKAGMAEGYYVQPSTNDVKTDLGYVTIVLPDSVAEYFRQQGRRALQRELITSLGVEGLIRQTVEQGALRR